MFSAGTPYLNSLNGAFAMDIDTFAIPRTTAALDNAFWVMVPPRRHKKTKITLVDITSGGTAHTWYFMCEKGRTTLAAAAAGSATTLVLTKDPGAYSTNTEWLSRGLTPPVSNNPVAANDFLVVRLADGSTTLVRPSGVATDSVTGQVTLTVSAIPATGALAGATVWFLGAAGDSNPLRNAVDPTVVPATSATSQLPTAASAGTATLAVSFHADSPVLIYNANATAASVLNYGTATYGE